MIGILHAAAAALLFAVHAGSRFESAYPLINYICHIFLSTRHHRLNLCRHHLDCLMPHCDHAYQLPEIQMTQIQSSPASTAFAGHPAIIVICFRKMSKLINQRRLAGV
jgi:hypothetical protein